jgi:Mycolic acid cyclopropane synthetase
MARKYGVQVKAFNISREQILYARKRVAETGLANQVEFIEDDYRNIGRHRGEVQQGATAELSFVSFRPRATPLAILDQKYRPLPPLSINRSYRQVPARHSLVRSRRRPQAVVLGARRLAIVRPASDAVAAAEVYSRRGDDFQELQCNLTNQLTFPAGRSGLERPPS